MSTGRLRLEDLTEDVLYPMLCFCDVYTVLSLSQVNRNFRRIAYAKHLWTYLIQNLVARRLIDLPHNRAVTDYSIAELIEEVKRVVLGPKTWSDESSVAPVVSRELQILRTFTEFLFPHFRLLRGGKYLLVEVASHIELQLWDVTACAVVWSLQGGSLERSQVEVIDEDTAIFVGLESSYRLVRVIQITLSTGDSSELFRVEAPPDTFWEHYLAVSGEFYMCVLAVSGRPRHLVIGNWRTETTAVLKYEHSELAARTLEERLQLAAGHIFFTAIAGHPFPPHHLRLSVVSANECLNRHQPNRPISTDDAISIYDLPAVVLQDLPFRHKIYQTKLVVHESPLRHDTYKCTILLVGKAVPKSFLRQMRWRLSSGNTHAYPLPEHPCNLYTFHLSTARSNNRFVGWQQTSFAAGVPCLLWRHGIISYAGYVDAAPGLSMPCSLANVHLRDPRSGRERIGKEEKPLLRAPTCLGTRYLSPHSHAVVTHTNSHYVISYHV
ncbi:hypothetical protein C8J57DRAFT_1360540 [Mycena rebaudengoi]|nr:hypothetical protein C8J57DRAFT_1360540 [Mycena rebaudengoi]